MTKEVLKLIHQKVARAHDEIIDELPNAALDSLVGVLLALEELMAQPEQEPVAWMNEEMDCIFFDAERPEPFASDFWKPLYTTPPQRTWVGLTDEEKSDIWCVVTKRDFVTEDTHVYADAIEAKLKEKNS